MTEPEVHVEVTPGEAPQEPASSDTTVVISDGGDSGIHPTVAEFMAQQAATNERLLAALENTAAVADSAASTAQVATDAVEGAVAEVGEIASEVSATVDEARPQPEPDQPPAHHEHRWYAKRGGNG